MSVKINKNGKEYDLGFIPQSLYDDVAYLMDKETMYMAVENVSLTTATRTFDFSSYFSGKSITKIKRQFAILMSADANVELQRLSDTDDYKVILINKDNNNHSVYIGYYVFV